VPTRWSSLRSFGEANGPVFESFHLGHFDDSPPEDVVGNGLQPFLPTRIEAVVREYSPRGTHAQFITSAAEENRGAARPMLTGQGERYTC